MYAIKAIVSVNGWLIINIILIYPDTMHNVIISTLLTLIVISSLPLSFFFNELGILELRLILNLVGTVQKCKSICDI